MNNEEKKESLLPVYLINGEDELKRETVLKRLKKRIASLGDLAFNFDEFDGEIAIGTDIVTACNTLPFASEVRLVLVQHADKLKKVDSEELVQYLAAPNPTTILALVSEKLAKNTRLYKAVAAVGKKAIIDCTPQKKYELVKSLRSMAVGHGFTLTEGAAQKLVELVGENTIFLDNELKKLALSHRGTDSVNEHEVQSLVSRTSEIKPWEFVDAFSARNIDRAIFCLARMESTSPHALLAMCVNRIRELICARSLHERGCARDVPKILKAPDWKVKNHVAWARNFGQHELPQAIISARDAEQAMKSGSDPQAVFTDWVLKTISR